MKGLIVSVLSAIIIFWLIFFKLAPWIASLIPEGDYHRIATVVVYVIIGYAGGISIPLTIIMFGIYQKIKER